MKHAETDFLIVGSGFGAAAPALRLTEAGYKVLMVEKGKYIDPSTDFIQTQDPKYFLQYLKTLSSENIGLTYAEAYGGGSGFYEMVSLRTPSAVFRQKDKKGRPKWPGGISRKVMDPFYETAERMLNVEQLPADRIPKSGVAFSSLMKNLGYSCERARYAVKGCVGSGYCISGCIFGAKQSLHYNYLPQAQKNGMEVMCNTAVQYIASAGRGNRDQYRYKARCLDTSLNELIDIKAKYIILAAGTIGTARILLSSKEHLPLLSQQVGKNIAFNGSVKAAGILSDKFIEGDMFTGMSHSGMISYHFFDELGITISAAKPLPLFAVSDARLSLSSRKTSYWGKDNIDLMKLYRKRILVLYALGTTEASAEIRYRNNSFSVHLETNDTLDNYYKKTKELLNSIFTKNGCEPLEIRNVNSEGEAMDETYFSSSHMTGSCRMAENKKEGVTDPNGEVFGYPGIYITDGAAIPGSLAVNSALTILANAERISGKLIQRLKDSKIQRFAER